MLMKTTNTFIATTASLLLALTGSANAIEKPPIKEATLTLKDIPSSSGSLSLVFASDPVCHFADMDIAISECLASDPDVQLLLTIEPLNEAEGSEPVAVIPLSNVTAITNAKGGGHQVDVSLHGMKSSGVYGIFVCKVSKGGTQSCRDKKFESMNKLLQRYMVDPARIPEAALDKALETHMNKRASEGTPDRVYHFKPIFLKNGNVQFIDGLMTESMYKKLKFHVLNMGLQASIVDTIKSYDMKMTSSPLTLVNGNAIRVNMPRYDKASCG